MELIVLFVPYLLGIILFISLCFLCFRKWRLGLSVLIICICVNWWMSCLTFTMPSFSDKSETLKVMSFNCNHTFKNEDVLDQRTRIIELIKKYNPDVVFLTENFLRGKEDSVWLSLKTYPFHTFLKNHVGNSIYSKYPLFNETIYQEKGIPYGITFCEIRYKDCIIDVFGCHLSSNNYNEHMEYMTPDSLDDRHEVKSYLKNILAAGKHRQLEAKNIIDFHDSTKPTIIMGDFNDVCGSPTLKIFDKAGFKDAWWKRGLGYGATIHHPLPYRIDHIMYNDKLKLKSITKIDAEGISDHDALMAEFSINKN